MSCCNSCSQGYDCESGLMSGLMGALVASGSEVKIGFEYGSTATSAQSIAGEDDPAWIRQVITQALLGVGLFDVVNVVVTPPAYAGLQHGYILVQGRLKQDAGSVIDLESAIEQIVSSEYLPITLTRRDPLAVLSVPQGRTNIQQPFDTTQPPSGQPGACNWDTMSFGDYFACQLGIKSPIGGVGAGAVGGLAAAGLLALVAIVVLKRF
jgi:hypothetical protein